MISSQFALSALPPWLKRNSLGRKDCGPSIPHRNRRAGRVQAGGFVNLFHLCYPPVWLHQPSTPPPIHFLRLSSSITLSGLVAPTGLINLGFDERRVWSNILEVPNELTDGPLHIITIWHSQWLVFSGITTTECMLVGYTGILMTQESVCGMWGVLYDVPCPLLNHGKEQVLYWGQEGTDDALSNPYCMLQSGYVLLGGSSEPHSDGGGQDRPDDCSVELQQQLLGKSIFHQKTQ